MSGSTQIASGRRVGWFISLAVLLCVAAVGCGGGGGAVQTLSVTVNPSSITLLVSGTQQFFAQVTSGNSLASDQTVKWLVNDVEGGNSAVGTITTAGVYTAPATVPSSANVTIKAVANIDPKPSGTATVTVDSGVRIGVSPGSATIGTSETFQFIASVTGTTSTDVTWLVNDVAGGNGTVGTITSSGLYQAPDNVPSPATVTVKATAQTDTSKSATASTTIVTAADPTLTSIRPTSAAHGSLFQDVYLNGSSFISTTKVLFNNQVISSAQITALSGGGLLRVRVPPTLLSPAGPFPFPYTVQVQRQSAPAPVTCTPDPTPCRFTVTAVRPAVVGTSPDNGTQGPAATSINVNGGYFGPTSGSSVTAEFDGNPPGPRTFDALASNPRQLKVNLISGDLNAAGLIPLTLKNQASAQLLAVTNFAVQPTGLPVVVNSPAVGTAPGGVAVNLATGIAVVTNRGTNNLSLVDLTVAVPTVSTLPADFLGAGAGPTGVAVDTLTNRAIVANGGNNTVSVVNLGPPAVLAATISANISSAPNSVGVNPLTGLALVAYKSTNVASIIDLKLNPPAVIGVVTVATGPNPQVAVEPRLNWAVVTPGAISGGPGSLAIVDLGRQSSNVIASNGASRSGGTVTITTTAAHGLQVGQGVLITGVTDPSFNGYFTVLAVPSSTTFTYTQSGGNVSSGGGLARYSAPLATFGLSSGVAGISINPETEKAVVADPNTNTVSVLSILDQSVNSRTLQDGCSSGVTCAVATAVNPLTNTAVSVDSFLNTATIIDPGSTPPGVLQTISVGTGPKAVAVDPGSNRAVVVNEGSNTVTVLSLGSIRPVHITQIAPPAILLTSSTPSTVPVTVIGSGFTVGSTIRLDESATGVATVFVSSRQLTAMINKSQRLTGPRRFALDVMTGSNRSNVDDFAVVQAVPLTDGSCTSPAPRGVAIEAGNDVAVVTNPGCNSISVIDLNSANVRNTVTVGQNPQGVAVISRLGNAGKAVVTNRTDGTASIVNLDDGSICDSCTVTVGSEPLGVAINQDTATAVVGNVAANSVSVFSSDSGGSATTTQVDIRPLAVAVDPARNIAAVAGAHLPQNPFDNDHVNVLDLSPSAPTVKTRINTDALPTSVVFDPSTNVFIATPSLANRLAIFDPDAAQQPPALRIGINPTSVAYNFQASTLVTLNSASNTMSVVDFLDRRIRAVQSFAAIQGLSPAPSCLGFLGPSGNQQPPCGVDIHPRRNLAVIADGDNHRVLLVPLPR